MRRRRRYRPSTEQLRPRVIGPEAEMSEQRELGPCHCCGQTGPLVRNFMLRDFEAPVPGTGWGCAICDLPSNGAISVLCDACSRPPVCNPIACFNGPPRNAERVAVVPMARVPFGHDQMMHDAYDASTLGAQLMMQAHPRFVRRRVRVGVAQTTPCCGAPIWAALSAPLRREGHAAICRTCLSPLVVDHQRLRLMGAQDLARIGVSGLQVLCKMQLDAHCEAAHGWEN
jgi:hypothetical protein